MQFEHPRDITEESQIVQILCFRKHPLKLCLYYLLSIISGFLLPLFARWYIWLTIRLKYTQADPSQAEVLVICGHLSHQELVPIRKEPLFINGKTSQYRVFSYRYIKYYFDEPSLSFKPVQSPFFDITCKELIEGRSQGLNDKNLISKLTLNYGKNLMDIQLKSNFMIFVDELLSPFYIFQVFSCILWTFFENYYVYAAIIFLTTTATLISSVISIKKNLKAIQKDGQYITTLKAFRENTFQQLSSTELVPGDLVVINDDEIFPCDMVLLSGKVIVDESILTGESIPVFKEPLKPLANPFITTDFPQSVLFAGTKCLTKRVENKDQRVLALVLNTGFSTTKAKLIKSFMFSPPDNFVSNKDSLKFICGLGIFALVGFCASVGSMVKQGVGAKEIIIKSLDLITTALPPALTTVLTLGAEISAKRLKSSGILAKSRSKINLAGKVEVMCFDKTGTLTEESLRLHEILYQDPSQKCLKIPASDIASTLTKDSGSHLLKLMASCHSLTHIKGEIRGDPLELDMFAATKWQFPDKSDDTGVASTSPTIQEEIKILKRFEFLPELQRMSVLIQEGPISHIIFTKGSPEKVLELCKRATIPTGLSGLIATHAKEGFRILACAMKKVSNEDISHESRSFYESDLEFLGLLIFINELRPSSANNIAALQEAKIRTIMITGDNHLTAIHTAKSCGMISKNQDTLIATALRLEPDQKKVLSYRLIPWGAVEEKPLVKDEGETEIRSGFIEESASPKREVDEKECFELTKDLISSIENGEISLAITGEAMALLRGDESQIEIMNLFLKKGTVFARMSPMEKGRVIEDLIHTGKIVGMCGDGANDCTALTRAHVGISIGNGEASLAAPFSTPCKDISCVLTLLKEGRAALCTSIQCFKYMALYSVIQTTSMILIYNRRSNLTEWSFNFADIFLNFPLAIGLSFSRPAAKLSKARPESKLMSSYVLSSVVGLGLIQSIFQIIMAIIIVRQLWYEHTTELHPTVSEYSEYNLNYDTTCLFIFSTFQYIATAIAFSFGRPHRVPMYKNLVFVGMVVLTLTCCLFLCFADYGWMKSLMDHMVIPDNNFKVLILLIALGNGGVTLFYEELCIKINQRRKRII